jgi:succinoglycan biosynthesis transport protein ExoP
MVKRRRGEEASPGFGDYADLIRRRALWIVTIVPAVILLSVYLAFALPTQYRSTATIILEPSSIPPELIKTSVASYAHQEIQIISGRVMTLETMMGLVRDFDPYPEETQMTLQQKAQRVLTDMGLEEVDAVTLEPLVNSEALSIHYQNPNPQRAAAVALRLADLFLSYHQRERSKSAQEASKLIADQNNALNAELHKLDDEYAQLRMRHGDALPDAKDRNVVGLDRAERDVDDAQRMLRAAQERESLLSIQLSGMSPNLLANKGDLTDLPTVKAQLADAEQRYTPDHPDVKRLRRALASLLAQQNGRGSGTAAVKADNPEYLRVASELESAKREVAALQRTSANARAKLDQYSALLRSSPEIERQFADLQRRRESLHTQFQQSQEKMNSAAMGQQFEAAKQGEHFSMIRAPYAASSPYYPNRLGMILLGVVLAGLIAAIAVAIAEGSDATVRGARDIEGSGQASLLLGGIPVILRQEDHHRRRLVWGSVCAVYMLFALVVAATVLHAR